MMIIKKQTETYECIAEEVLREDAMGGVIDGNINRRTANLVRAASQEMYDETEDIDVTACGVEEVIVHSWGVNDLSSASRLTTYVMMLASMDCTRRDVLDDVRKGRVKL